jgi:GNAT superfamily N-acetyltransferase
MQPFGNCRPRLTRRPTHGGAKCARRIAIPRLWGNQQIAIVERKPTIAEYESIVASVGFRRHENTAVEIALANTVFAVCAVEEQEVVGVGRVVGDGAISFLLTNIMVRPSHQRRGIGTRIVCGFFTVKEWAHGKDPPSK